MDRESRRNSILKPVYWNQVDYEEEATETVTISRRKSFKKRVSFAGRDEIKEFQKHEVLTVDKLEQALNNIHSQEQEILEDPIVEKENLNIQSLTNSSDDQAKATISNTIQNKTVNEFDDSKMLLESGNSLDVSMDVCSTSPVQIVDLQTNMVTVENMLPPSMAMLDTTIAIQNMDCSATQDSIQEKCMPNPEVEVCSENVSVIMSETRTDEDNKDDLKNNISIESNDVSENLPGNSSPSLCFSDDGAGEFYQVAKTLQWNIVKSNENELILSRKKNYLTVKFKLDNEFCVNNVKHYTIEDIEFDTTKAYSVEDKWARFGFSLLDNTMEQSNLMGICSSTQDLPKLLHTMDEHVRTFLKFMTEDSLKFEDLVHPRSIKFSMEYTHLTFELSNLENLLWIRVTLKLNSIFPLVAEEVTIENVLGTLHRAELNNMISTIRPSGLYLTHVAECIDDFLKFRTMNKEKKKMDITQNKSKLSV